MLLIAVMVLLVMAGWTCKVVSGMFTLGRWQGMDWQEKLTVKNCGRALVKPKNQPGGIMLAPRWLKLSTTYTVDVWDIWTAKTSSNTGYSQLRDLPVPKAAIQAFHITVNSSLLQSASSK